MSLKYNRINRRSPLKRGILLLICLLAGTLLAEAQAPVSDGAGVLVNYLHGQGKGTTLAKADQAALSELVTQATMEITVNNSALAHGMAFAPLRRLMFSYTAEMAELAKVEVDSANQYAVGYHLKKSEVPLMLERRKKKVEHFVKVANDAFLNLNMGDALKYYQWAYALLQSLPAGKELRVDDEDAVSRLAQEWIPRRLREIVGGIEAKMTTDPVLGKGYYRVTFFYGGQPVSSLDYTYNDGAETMRATARDGLSVIHLSASHEESTLTIEIDHQYLDEARGDASVMNVMSVLRTLVSCANAQRVLPTQGDVSEEMVELKRLQKRTVENLRRQNEEAVANNMSVALDADHLERYQRVMEVVMEAIRTHNYENVRPYCTDRGYRLFDTLMRYGNAIITEQSPNLLYNEYLGNIYCRSLPMTFRFSPKHSTDEQVVFVFTPEGKIDFIQFGLGMVATNSILEQPESNIGNKAKPTMIDFLENYKTAYGLHRLDYLQQIYSDEAVIMTGTVIQKLNGNVDNGYIAKVEVHNTISTKAQFIGRLENVFRKNEFVNLKFANSQIIQSPSNPDVYAVQIQQDYFSSTYNDSGYLMLVVDLSDAKKPVIYVRVWQPQPDDEFGFVSYNNYF